MSSYTPGTWRYFKNIDGQFSIWPEDTWDTKIAEVCTKGIDDPEANARLMASAPEMKIALIEGVELMRGFEVFMCAQGLDTKDLNKAIGIINGLLDRIDGQEEL